jgi:hypothetical protein
MTRTITQAARRPIPKVQVRVPPVCCAAALFTIMPSSCARRTVSASNPIFVAAISGFGLWRFGGLRSLCPFVFTRVCADPKIFSTANETANSARQDESLIDTAMAEPASGGSL